MKNLRCILLSIVVMLPACQIINEGINHFSPSRRLAKAEKEIHDAENDYWRLHPLGIAAMASVDVGDYKKARRYADELLRLSVELYSKEKPDDDGTHKGNLVLGRLALRDGNVEEAKSHLLKSAMVKGSPVLGSFGPNMTLAKELLEKGEREAVLEYFDLCANFWEFHRDDTLKKWKSQVEAGKIPDFGANLVY
jgi:hypothetical protein